MNLRTYASKLTGPLLIGVFLATACSPAAPAPGAGTAPITVTEKAAASTSATAAPAAKAAAAPVAPAAPAAGSASPAPAASAAAASPVASAAPVVAASRPPLSKSTLKFALSTASALQVLVPLGIDAGYFKEEGLDIDLTQITGGQAILSATATGDIDMANTDGATVAAAIIGGADNTIVAIPVSVPIYELMVVSSITKPADLVGKTIGVTAVCQATCFQIKLWLQSQGIAPDSVPVIAIREFAPMLAGMSNGQLAGGVMPPPFNFQAVSQGYHSLVDLRSTGMEFPSAPVHATKKFISTHPDTVQAFLRAYVKASHRFRTDQAFALDVYRRFLKSDDTELLRNTWGFFAPIMREDPAPTASIMKSLLDDMVRSGDERAGTADPASLISPQLLQQALQGAPR
jgi:ABC-type nitrate/sulfonate/bicarbonate transport system substrate-binding protein